ncbi:MAG: ATP-binding protein [Bacilli bacterium]|jgi:uncharacterized protein YPO0396
MKLLRKVKIINWHYFWNETINIEPIVFLTGLNASGKSTLIDALQVVLLGDTSGRFFNKAAMDKSNRTLKGYLRGELGDTEEGGFHYLRNGRFTSYIALEFFDDLNEVPFTLGIVFDTYEDGSEDHRFFILEDKIPENEFIVDDLPMEYKTLNAYFQEHYPNKYTFYETNRQYQEALKRVLGGLKDRYFSLLKKAVSFTPITDITTFITEYVCDPQQQIDIIPMQENILQYKRLEDEALVMKERVRRLEEIKETHDLYLHNVENMKLFEYIIEKAMYQMDKDRLLSYESQIETANRRLSEIDTDLADLDVNIAELNRRKMRLIQESATSSTYKITDELMLQKENTQKKITDLEMSNLQIKSSLEYYLDNFIKSATSINEIIADFDEDLLSSDALNELNLLKNATVEVIQLSNNIKDVHIDNLLTLDINALYAWRDALQLFKQRVNAMYVSLARTIQRVEEENAYAKQQEIDLRHGGKAYERVLVQIRNELQNELSSRHNKSIPVMFYADLVDIRTPKWVNAIEGFLHSQKFNLFVESEYYLEAYAILRSLLDRYHYYGTTLVDQDRLIERRFEARRNSLAEEIITDHLGAEAYTNFLIGTLQKCETIEQARNSGNGITPACDLYRNFSFGKINPRFYREAFIGRAVEEAQINEKRLEIKRRTELIEKYKVLYNAISEANTLEIINTNEINNIANVINSLGELKPLKETLVYLDEELKKHDLGQLESLQKRIDLIDDDIKTQGEEKNILFEEKGKLTTQLESLREEKIPETKKVCEEREQKLLEQFDVFFIDEKAEPEFSALLEKGMSPLEIVTDYRVKFGHAQYLVNNVFSQLTKLRKEYTIDYRLTYDTQMSDNAIYEDELNDLKEVKLPEYDVKIHDAYQKAVKQFKDDFISKLRSAIETVEDQIIDLNDALSASTFGQDSYRFTVKPSAVYRQYYDMIKDDLLLQVTDSDSEFFEKYDDVMKDLFAQIVLSSKTGDQEAAVLANVERFTDYRNYLDFDLIVKDKTGNEQRLSRMLKKKSGGETQTPFYIAVLASFAQLYRVNDSGELGNTCRLIIFDEAFSKMDSGRIKESIRLLRKFGLQAILSAPSDKVADISELVDETLVVLRGRNASHVHLYAEEDRLTKS